MKLASRDRNAQSEVFRHKLFLQWKTVQRWLRFRPGAAQRVVLVLGCQRSGTTLLGHMLELDRDSAVHGEMETLVDPAPAAAGIRWRPLPWVKERLAAERARFVVTKPLVESHRAHELLDALPEARVVWLYRHYLDVARSNLNFFGPRNGIDDLRPLVTDEPDNWRSEGQPEHVRQTVREHFAEDMDELSAAALFWWTRNALFFHQDLAREPRAAVIRYDDLVTAPAAVMQATYRWLDLPYPGDRITGDVFASSVGRGRDRTLAPGIAALCEQMYARLEALPRLGPDGGEPAA